MNTLHEQQCKFALHMVADENRQPEFLSLALKQSPLTRFSDTQRLQIYRNNFVISLREALAAVYPVVQKLVGGEFFQHVAREYMQQHPSRTGNLHDFGDALPGFLESFPGLEALPYLPDVARLEWAYHQVFHTTEERVLNIAALSVLDESQTAELSFQLSAGCVFLSSDYPVLDIWKANQQGNEGMTVSLDGGGVQFLVLRHGRQIEFHPLSVGMFVLIESLAQHKSFAHACKAALNVEADCDITAALQFFVQQKIVVGFSRSCAV